MQGKIIKGIAGFYYVYATDASIYECKAKGAFRNQKVKPLVGDDVEIQIVDPEKKKGNVEEILPRKMSLIRPAVANVDMALVIFAAAKPEPNLNLLDRFLCMMDYQHVPVTIVFNKCDLIDEEQRKALADIYEGAGYQVLFTSIKQGIGVDKLQEVLKGKTTTVAGPSGVGKSSTINALQSHTVVETGELSEKIARGKNTTRHSEIIPISSDTFIVDTPGFSSMDAPEVEKEDLWRYFPEFVPFEPYCKFQGCSHIHEPNCGVKDALAEGKISHSRYDNYVLIYEEMKQIKRY